MDRVSRCVHCGKRLVLTPSVTKRIEMKCVFCDKLDPLQLPEAKKWADSPLANLSSEPTP